MSTTYNTELYRFNGTDYDELKIGGADGRLIIVDDDNVNTENGVCTVTLPSGTTLSMVCLMAFRPDSTSLNASDNLVVVDSVGSHTFTLRATNGTNLWESTSSASRTRPILFNGMTKILVILDDDSGFAYTMGLVPVRVASGSYTGDSSPGHSIYIGFVPSIIILRADDGLGVVEDINNNPVAAGYMLPNASSDDELKLFNSSTGNSTYTTVYFYKATQRIICNGSATYPYMNKSGGTYSWVAIG